VVNNEPVFVLPPLPLIPVNPDPSPKPQNPKTPIICLLN